jgi:exodeoxyribonuclease V alpha subunit
VGELNKLAEQTIFDAGLLEREGQWYGGRPIMITRNDYNLKLFNGDIGIAFPDGNGKMRVFFAHADGQIRKFSPARLPAHETVFRHDYSQKSGL